ACRDRLRAAPVDLSQYTTATNADDVDDLRRVLGFDKWDLFGVSYGTRLGLEVMRRHPENVRAVVLDSVLPAQVDLLAQFPANIARALELVFARCTAEPTCEKAYPGLRQVLVATLTELAAHPVTLNVGLQSIRLDAQPAMP